MKNQVIYKQNLCNQHFPEPLLWRTIWDNGEKTAWRETETDPTDMEKDILHFWQSFNHDPIMIQLYWTVPSNCVKVT